MKNRCKICKSDAGDYRICRSCYEKAFRPCSNCGKQTPGVTLLGKEAIRTTCKACTSHFTADTRRIGKTCLVCRTRFQSEKKANAKSVCDTCMGITVPCPQCGNPMPRYKEKGGQRKFCSYSCTSKSVPSETRSIASAKAHETISKTHVYKSHQNDLARGTKQYLEWRKSVFERDNYTCQTCGIHSGNGHAVNLHPHHIQPFATCPELRYELSNGVTLCATCHRLRHDHVFIGKTKKLPSRVEIMNSPTFWTLGYSTEAE